MAISSFFASRLVPRIATALLYSFVFSISTSYAAQIPLSHYEGLRIRPHGDAIHGANNDREI